MRKRPVTIAQVADDAGVSVPTVSRVLNGTAVVAEATRRNVVRSIERLGYHPNPLARGLSLGHSDAVLVIVPHITEPSVTIRLGGLIDVLRDSPYELHLVDVERPAADRPRSLADIVAHNRPAAVVLVSLLPDADETERLCASGLPIAMIDAAVPGLPGDTIDDVQGGVMATEYFITLGHRRIAFIGDDESTAIGVPASADRRVGFARTMGRAGIPVPAGYVRMAPHGTETAAVLADGLLTLPEPPTAVFAASDVQALGVISAARRAGMRVPEDLSIIGYDDIDAAALVGLTTVRQPLQITGRRAGLHLLGALGHETDAPMPPLPPLELVVRDTTAPPAGTTATSSRTTSRKGEAESVEGESTKLGSHRSDSSAYRGGEGRA